MTDNSHSQLIGPMIIASAEVGLGYAKRLLEGVTEQNFARWASVGGQTVQSNHPCFVLGHLSLYAPRVVKELGGDASGIGPSDKYVELFGKDSQCQDDVDGSLYPPMQEVVDAFFNAHQRAIETLATAKDEQFYQPNPNEAMAARFPTVGAMHSFYLSGHVMIHIGQFSAWRRMQGLPPA